jgi:hypothetical protein
MTIRALSLSRLALAALVLLMRAPIAHACPCSDNPGSGGPLTTTRDRFGVALSESISAAHGVWDGNGRYSRFDGERGAVFWTLAGAVRPIPRVELNAELGAGRSFLRVGEFEAEHRGLSDATFGVFWDAFDEPMPYENEPWPSLTLLARVRAPTGGTASSASTASSDTTGGRSGLGTFEGTLGLRAAKGLAERTVLAFSSELSLRAPDESLGVERQLGPRAVGMLAVTQRVSAEVSLELGTSLAWEGEVTLRGQRLGNTAQRLWNVEAAALWSIAAGLGASASVGGAPPLSAISKNALGGVRGGLSLKYLY